VIGHEGRHRAAALVNAGISKMIVLLVAYEEGSRQRNKLIDPDDWKTRPFAVHDFPKTFYGQFNGKAVKIDYSRFKLLR